MTCVIQRVLFLLAFATITPSALADDVSRSPFLDAARIAAEVEHWVTCTECGTAALERIERRGDAAVESLEKAYRGDAAFLRIPERQRAFAQAYDRFSHYLAEPVSRDDYVKDETAKVLWLAQARAKATLERIGTTKALEALKRGREATRTGQ
jgi:hypothetical protein